MDNVCGVNVLETAKGLIDKGLEMSVREWLLGSDLGWRALSDQRMLRKANPIYNGVQICLHQLLLEVRKKISDGDSMRAEREDSRIDRLRQSFHPV